jgi:hypothetical protein
MAWNDLLRKEARCIDGLDIGDVWDVDEHYLLTQKGMLNKQKERFYIPIYLVEKYDSNTVWFRMSGQEARDSFMIASQPSSDNIMDAHSEKNSFNINTIN